MDRLLKHPLRPLSLVSAVIGVAVLLGVLLTHYWRGLRNPDFFCGTVAAYPVDALLSESGVIGGEPSLFPLGITCTYPARAGGQLIVEPTWTATACAALGVALIVLGIILWFVRGRSGENLPSS